MNVSNPLVYIIDNDLISAFNIKIRLQQSCRMHRTQFFEDSDSAFAMLDTGYKHINGIPDIMFVCFDLPGMDGLKFLNYLKENRLLFEKSHIYLLSKNGVPDYVKNSDWDDLIKGYFTKPIENKDMAKIFARHLSENSDNRSKTM